jgi:hypothetical protein
MSKLNIFFVCIFAAAFSLLLMYYVSCIQNFSSIVENKKMRQEVAKFQHFASFDHKFYINKYSDIKHLATERKSLQHWKNFGIKEGRRSHLGPKVMKIVLMTRNEFPMIKSWVFYHGTIFGFNNLFIIDGSNDPDAISFLDHCVKLGVNVRRSNNDLNGLSREINEVFDSQKEKSDFLIKMDTDEFLVLFDPATKKISNSKADIINYLDKVVYDGSMYKIGFTGGSFLSEETSRRRTRWRKTSFSPLLISNPLPQRLTKPSSLLGPSVESTWALTGGLPKNPGIVGFSITLTCRPCTITFLALKDLSKPLR